mgnify:FL=1
MVKGNDIDLENIFMKKWKCEKKRVNKRKTKIIMEENGKKFDFLVKPRAIVMGRNIERNLDFRDRVREYFSKSGIRLLKAQDIKK